MLHYMLFSDTLMKVLYDILKPVQKKLMWIALSSSEKKVPDICKTLCIVLLTADSEVIPP